MSATFAAGGAWELVLAAGWAPVLSMSMPGAVFEVFELPMGVENRTSGEEPGSWDCQRREGFWGAWDVEEEPWREWGEVVREGALEEDMVAERYRCRELESGMDVQGVDFLFVIVGPTLIEKLQGGGRDCRSGSLGCAALYSLRKCWRHVGAFDVVAGLSVITVNCLLWWWWGGPEGFGGVWNSVNNNLLAYC